MYGSRTANAALRGTRWTHVTGLAVDRGAALGGGTGASCGSKSRSSGRSPGVIEVEAEGESSFVRVGEARFPTPFMRVAASIDTTVEAFVPGEMDRAAERPVAARQGPVRI